MITTLEHINILEKADALSQMILESNIAEDYFRCLYKVQNDEQAQQLIKRFLVNKEKYEDVQRFGKHHPDYLEITVNVREAKRDLDLHETVAEFKKAENAVQEILDEISVLLGRSVSDQIKVATGNPFFDSLNQCGGGCSTGGGCGCKAS